VRLIILSGKIGALLLLLAQPRLLDDFHRTDYPDVRLKYLNISMPIPELIVPTPSHYSRTCAAIHACLTQAAAWRPKKRR